MLARPVPLSALLACALAVATGCGRVEGDGRAATRDARLERVIERATGAPAAALAMPTETDLADIPQDPLNPLTPAKVELGRALFHDTGFGAPDLRGVRRDVSCATCHDAAAGFQAGRVQGVSAPVRLTKPEHLGHVDAQGIRTPSVLNVAYQSVLHWNGQLGAGGPNEGTERQWTRGTAKAVNHRGYSGPEAQAIAGLETHGFAVTPERIEELGYGSDFREAFGTLPQNPAQAQEAAALALAAYQRTLLPTQAPFQRWLRGERQALAPAQLRGAEVFFGRGKCSSCHNGPSLSDGDFHALGMADLYAVPEPTVNASADMGVNLGRAGFTHRTADLYAFKTPQLYNLADSPFYGHGSSHRTLEDVVVYHLRAASENPRVAAAHLDEDFRPVRLSQRELEDLVTFLRDGLRDPSLSRYVPSEGSPAREPTPSRLSR